MQIYLGNLAFTVTEQDVRELFAPYGVVDRINLITDRETGRPRGFGFVEMADDQAAQAAIAALHGQDLAGRALTVNAARPRDERRPFGGGRRWETRCPGSRRASWRPHVLPSPRTAARKPHAREDVPPCRTLRRAGDAGHHGDA